MKQLHVGDRVMTLYDACTSGTFRVLIVVSLQWLKMEALIPAPADCEVQSMIKFLSAQSIAPIEIHSMKIIGYETAKSDICPWEQQTK